jgi:hypothetical protein
MTRKINPLKAIIVQKALENNKNQSIYDFLTTNHKKQPHAWFCAMHGTVKSAVSQQPDGQLISSSPSWW